MGPFLPLLYRAAGRCSARARASFGQIGLERPEEHTLGPLGGDPGQQAIGDGERTGQGRRGAS
jgi:hypothetical protein